MMLSNQGRKLETRAYISGKPRAHATPQDTTPMTEPPTTNGPPESPIQVPSPSSVKVQMVLLNTKALLAALSLDRQTADVRVRVFKNIRLLDALPGCYRRKEWACALLRSLLFSFYLRKSGPNRKHTQTYHLTKKGTRRKSFSYRRIYNLKFLVFRP